MARVSGVRKRSTAENRLQPQERTNIAPRSISGTSWQNLCQLEEKTATTVRNGIQKQAESATDSDTDFDFDSQRPPETG
jgi:hypothetical protein